MKSVFLKTILMIMSIILLGTVTSCDDEYPADEGTVTVKVKNFKVDTNAESYKWPTLEIYPCYDKTITLYKKEITNKTNYTEKVILNTGDYLITVFHPSFGFKSEYVQIRRGQNIDISVNAQTK